VIEELDQYDEGGWQETLWFPTERVSQNDGNFSYLVLLAIAIASSSVLNFMRGATGPKVSSRKGVISSVIFKRIVGGKKVAPPLFISASATPPRSIVAPCATLSCTCLVTYEKSISNQISRPDMLCMG
jgi:hypothetical protein